MIRILITDDHTLFRHGIRGLLDREGDLEIVGEAETGSETLRLLEETRPDVLLLDLSLPGGMSGAQTAEEALKIAPKLAIVVLTMHEDEYYLREMFAIGVHGFVLKRSRPEALITAVRAAASGEHYVDAALSRHVVSSFAGADAGAKSTKGRLALLTTREREVCRLLAMGHTNAEVAQQLFISDRTVESHRHKIMGKLDLKNRAELVRFAMDNDLLRLT